MPATNSQLQLKTYFLKQLNYNIKDGLDKIPERIDEIDPIGLEVGDFTTIIDEKENLWRCELVIKSADSKPDKENFYDFNIVMVGFFKVNPELPSDQAEMLAANHCPAVLYSTSREIIATVTRRSPYPAILLPLVMFVKNIDVAVDEVKPKTTRKTTKKKTN
jgi:preprotein translocase subunit SecB